MGRRRRGLYSNTKPKTRNPFAPIAPVFIPRTQGGALIDTLCRVEERLTNTGSGRKSTTPKLKLVEQAGVMLREVLTQSNPWADIPCDHPQCTTCTGYNTGDCKIRNVVYINRCLICKESGINTHYLGESGRTMAERSCEHQADALTQNKNSHMRSHMLAEHPSKLSEVLSSYRMDIKKKARSALERQVREAVEIARAPPGSLLNMKEEYNRCLLPSISLEGPKPIRVQEEEERVKNQGMLLDKTREEQALWEAKKNLKGKLDLYRAGRGPPNKRAKTTKAAPRPGYQLPPTWDIPTKTCHDEMKRTDIRRYLRPLRRLDKHPLPEIPDGDVQDQCDGDPQD